MGNRHLGFEGGLRVITTLKEMENILPKAKKWSKKMKSLVSDKKNYKKKDTEYFYTCNFTTPTDPKELEEYIADAEYAVGLPYEERLNYELTKMNINAFAKNGYLIIGDRIPLGIIPEKVVALVGEIVKIKMIVEFEVFGNEQIRSTVPPIDTTKVDPKMVENSLNALRMQMDEDIIIEEMSMDTILDKISMYGLGSITRQELEFLNEQSKRI